MKKITLMIAFCIVAITSAEAVKLQRYITVSGEGSMDGTSWSNAAKDITQVISDLSWDANWVPTDGADIFVGAGQYDAPANGFVMVDKINVYGGYPAGGGSTRDWVKNQTILDGKANKTRLLIQKESDPAFTDYCVWDGFVLQNGISGNGAAVLFTYKGVISNCIIRNCNSTGSYAIGIVQSKKNTAGSATGGTLYNCLIVNNICGKGTVNFNTAPGYFIYCTIANNKTTGFINVDAKGVGTDISTSGLSCAGVLMENYSHWSIGYNSIISGNAGQTTAQLVSQTGGIRNMTSCAIQGGVADVQGGQTVNTPNLILTDPLFVKPTSFTGLADTDEKWTELVASDFHIQSTSPCIGKAALTGIPTTFPLLPTVDLSGQTRIGSDGKADIGAFQTGGVTGVYKPAADIVKVGIVGRLCMLSGLQNNDNVRIYTTSGKLVYSNVAAIETMFVDASKFGKGVLVLSIERAGKKYAKKILN